MILYLALHKDKNTGYGVTVPALPGCFSYGETLETALKNAKEAIQLHLEGFIEDGKEPVVEQLYLYELVNNPDYLGVQWFGIEANNYHLSRFN